jgi:hypothetical protein
VPFHAVCAQLHYSSEEGTVGDVDFENLEQLTKSHDELTAHVVALTAVVGAMASTVTVDFERLEECICFAAKKLRPGRRPILFAKAAAVLEDLEVMQKVVGKETRKIRSLKKAAVKRQAGSPPRQRIIP